MFSAKMWFQTFAMAYIILKKIFPRGGFLLPICFFEALQRQVRLVEPTKIAVGREWEQAG